MQKIEILKDILIETGELKRYYGKEIPVNLWRAKKVRSPSPLFSIVEEEITRPRGAPRKPDITIKKGWVKVRNRPRGISTFDKPNIFKGHWEYFKLPAGTILPEGLVVVKDSYNSTFQATHYTIAPAQDMPLQIFKNILNQLLNLIEKENASGD